MSLTNLKKHNLSYTFFIALFLLFSNTAIASSHFNQFIEAAEKNNYSTLKNILNQNKKFINSTDSDGWTALMFMSYHNNLQAVKYLISIGANVNQLNFNNESSLMIAVASNSYETVNYLLEKNANVNIISNDGFNASYISHSIKIDSESGAKMKTALRNSKVISPTIMRNILKLSADISKYIIKDEHLSNIFNDKKNLELISNVIPSSVRSGLINLCKNLNFEYCKYPTVNFYNHLKYKVTSYRKKLQNKAEYGFGELQKYAGVYDSNCSAQRGEKYDFYETAEYFLNPFAYQSRTHIWARGDKLYFYSGISGRTGFNVTEVNGLKYIGDQYISYSPDMPAEFRPDLEYFKRFALWIQKNSVEILGKRYESILSNGDKFVFIVTDKNLNLGVVRDEEGKSTAITGNLCKRISF